MDRIILRSKWLAVLTFSALLAACAGAPRDATLPIDDPNEQFNRSIFAANQAILHPAAVVVKALPTPVIDRLRDVDQNLKEPRIFANDILQGRMSAAGTTLGRFFFNSTFGLAGLFDVATPGGLAKQTGDFGQTLFVWGVPSGSYVVEPYFGPSTQRDAVGGTVDLVADPVGWSLGAFGWEAGLATGGLGAAAHLGQLKEAEDSSIDFYSFLRADYYQLRRADLRESIGLPAETESPATDSPAAASAKPAKASTKVAKAASKTANPPPQ